MSDSDKHRGGARAQLAGQYDSHRIAEQIKSNYNMAQQTRPGEVRIKCADHLKAFLEQGL